MSKQKKKRNKPYRAKPVINHYARLNEEQRLCFNLFNYTKLDAMVSGHATEDDIYTLGAMISHWAMLRKANDEVGEKLMGSADDFMSSIKDRFDRTGKVGLSGVEISYLRELVDWFYEQSKRVSPDESMRAFNELKQSTSKLEEGKEFSWVGL